MHLIYRASLGAAALALMALPLRAAPLAEIEQHGVLRVGLTGDYLPYSGRETDGTFFGADVVMAQSLAKDLGVKLLIVPTTWKGLAADLTADRFDVAMGGITVTPDRAQKGDFSSVVSTDGKRPIVRCADKERYTSIQAIDQPGVKVIVNPGGTNQRFADANLAAAHIEVSPDNTKVFHEIAEGDADVMVTDGAEVDLQAHRHPGVLCAADVKEPFNHFDLAYWMTKDPALRAAVDKWLGQAQSDGTAEKARAAGMR
jgi:cyclohexadienyl dehydratase